MFGFTSKKDKLAAKQAEQDYKESHAQAVITDEIVIKHVDVIVTRLPNCYDMDRFAHHLRASI